MEYLSSIIHFANIFIIIVSSTLGSSIGSTKASISALAAINIQPRAKREITRTCLIGLALIETASILSIIICIFLITESSLPLSASIAESGIAFGMGISAALVGTYSAFPVQSTCLSIARQPFFGQRILNLMLILQSIIQTAAIFAFVVSLSIQFQLKNVTSYYHALSLASGGLAIGIASIGPIIGLSQFSKTACEILSRNRKIYGKIVSFAFMAGAIIETPLIFCLIVSISIILFSSQSDSFMHSIRMIAAAFCISCATFMTSKASSRLASTAGQQIVMNESHYGIISHASLLGQGLVDTSAIYALLVCLTIIILFSS